MALLIYSGLFAAIWVLLFAALLLTLWRLQRFHELLGQLPGEGPARWPLVSIIIPACNEAEHLEQALASVLALDYPALEIIVIDDRSTDETGAILERLAARDGRIQPLHIHSLPAGWLGKVHALHRGVQAARGQWYLFTDADIHFEAQALKQALRYALHHRIDHLALLPRVILHGFWVGVAIRSFGLLFLLSTRAARINRPDSRSPIGIGAFNLVRAESFRQTPGFDWLRMEPVDDYGLGVMLHEAGARSHFALADEYLAVPWYGSLGAMFKGLEKNLFGPGAHYRWWRALGTAAGLWALLAAPGVALLGGLVLGSAPLLACAALPIAMHLLFSLGLALARPGEGAAGLWFPLGVGLFSLMLLWSAYRCLKNGGIDWRGTHYSLDALRAGQRVRF